MNNRNAAAVNVAEAKRQFSDLLGRVAYGGETILITRRGRPMAKLIPVEPEARDGPSKRIEGWLDDNDPFFGIVESIVKSRSRHQPRVLPRQRQGRPSR